MLFYNLVMNFSDERLIVIINSLKKLITFAGWRDAGVVERVGLENRCLPLVDRGFESLSLRFYIIVPNGGEDHSILRFLD